MAETQTSAAAHSAAISPTRDSLTRTHAPSRLHPIYYRITEKLHELAASISAHPIDLTIPAAVWSSNAPRMQPRRYMFLTSTLGCGLWEPGDNVDVVFLTDERPALFWEAIYEHLDLTDEEGVKARQGMLEVPWRKLGFSGTDARVLGTRTVFVRWARLMEEFDLSLIPDYGIPTYTKRSGLPAYYAAHVDHVRHAIDLNSTLQTPAFVELDFPTIFRLLRRWAWAMGLMDKQLGLLDADTLLDLVMGAVRRWSTERQSTGDASYSLEAFFMRPEVCIPAYRSIRNATAHGATALEQALLYNRAADRIANLDLGGLQPKDGFKAFAGAFDDCLWVEAVCWDDAATQTKFYNHTLPEILKGLALIIHSSPAPCGQGIGGMFTARVWPFVGRVRMREPPWSAARVSRSYV